MNGGIHASRGEDYERLRLFSSTGPQTTFLSELCEIAQRRPAESSHVLRRWLQDPGFEATHRSLCLSRKTALKRLASQAPRDPALLIPDIKEQCRLRAIIVCCHFTKLGSIPSIMQLGILTRSELERRGLGEHATADQRLDGKDHVNLSITTVHFELFWRKKQREGGAWAVLEIDAAILWELPCKFTRSNAASSGRRGAKGAQREPKIAFDALFAADCPSEPTCKAHYPEDSQAEVLCLDTIPPRYVKQVCVERPDDERTLANQGVALDLIKLTCRHVS